MAERRGLGEMSYIKAEGLSFSYKVAEDREVPALTDVSFEIKKGEYTAVIGRNGSGKSTLAKLLNLIIEPSSGSLTVAGVKLSAAPDDETLFSLRRKVGVVFQNPDNQIIATVVEEDIAFGPENLGLEPEEIRSRVNEAIEAVGLKGFEKAEPARLSGGQKQRVAIAGVLAMKPECIIFDESTAMLDPIGRRDVLGIMKQLSDEGITIINITHLMAEAAMADKIIVLNRGRIEKVGTPHEIFSDTELIEKAGLSVPQSAELMNVLRARGIDAGFGITPAECADLIENAYKN